MRAGNMNSVTRMTVGGYMPFLAMKSTLWLRCRCDVQVRPMQSKARQLLAYCFNNTFVCR